MMVEVQEVILDLDHLSTGLLVVEVVVHIIPHPQLVVGGGGTFRTSPYGGAGEGRNDDPTGNPAGENSGSGGGGGGYSSSSGPGGNGGSGSFSSHIPPNK